MGLMDVIAADLDAVFFDTNAFAGVHLLDGEEVTVVTDEAELAEIKKSGGKDADGWIADINKHSILFYIREKDMKRKLTINSKLDFDGKLYFVNSLQKIGGCFKILIGREQV